MSLGSRGRFFKIVCLVYLHKSFMRAGNFSRVRWCLDQDNKPPVYIDENIEVVKIFTELIKKNRDLPFSKATSLGRSFSSMFEVKMLWEDGRISTDIRNSSIGVKMRTLWFFESATTIRPSSSQQIPDGRQNSCVAEPSCPFVARICQRNRQFQDLKWLKIVIFYLCHWSVNQNESMIFEIWDDNIALRIKSSASRRGKALQIAAVVDTVEREARDKVAIRAEELNAMVARVGHENLRFCVDGTGPRIHELA